MAELEYISTDSVLEYYPLWWHVKGLSQTATGYGMELTTPYKVKYNGRLYRVYCTRYSNCGTCWIRVSGKKLFVPDVCKRTQ